MFSGYENTIRLADENLKIREFSFIYRNCKLIYMIEKSRFLKVYSNLPIDIRKEIIAIVDEKPITWDVAYLEIEKETPLGKKILSKLIKLEMI